MKPIIMTVSLGQVGYLHKAGKGTYATSPRASGWQNSYVEGDVACYFNASGKIIKRTKSDVPLTFTTFQIAATGKTESEVLDKVNDKLDKHIKKAIKAGSKLVIVGIRQDFLALDTEYKKGKVGFTEVSIVGFNSGF